MPDRSDISPLSITDGKISKGAKIDPTKLAPATSGQVLIAGTDGKFRPGNLVTTSSGDTVAQGPAGPPGATGSQGATGATGATGANGTDASITEATVNAAGAVMHTDVPDSDTGFIKRTGAATYDVDTATYLTGNQTITLGGDVKGSGTTSISCSVDDDSHTHSEHSITALNTSAGASSAGKLIKLDAAGHVDATMINDADITVGTNQVTGLGGAAEKDVGTASDEVAAGNHAHAQYSTFDIDDASALTTDVWSASKIISYLSSFYAVLANGFSNHKYSAAIQWERTLAISETGWAQGSGSGAWQANQTYASLAQTSTTGSGVGALFNVAVDTSGVPTFIWVSGGGGYAVDDTLTFTDPGSTSQTCVVTVTTVFTPTGIGFSGTTGSMVCNLNHGLGTEYITMSVRGNDDVIEDLGHTSIVTVIDANNVKLEYLNTDYPSASDIAAGEDKFITIIG